MAARGRGFAMLSTGNSQTPELRRPGEAGLKQRFGSGSQFNGQTTENQKDAENPFSELCSKLGKINLSSSVEELKQYAKDVKVLCNTSEKLEKFIDSIFQFALKSKWNAHIVAIFCDAHGDITVDQCKFRTLMLRKLQVLYKERNKAYLELEKFLLDATFACEIFHHVQIDGVCVKILAHPILDYLGMLVDGASEKEIEIFIEQFPKCYKNLKENYAIGFETLVGKIRKQIVSQSTTVTVRAMLLEIFELILTDWKPIDPNAKHLYESLSKPINISLYCLKIHDKCFFKVLQSDFKSRISPVSSMLRTL
ncbi:uncharacterized protein NPIL_517731 [Nephila pilipes]|uniref:Uncharacterized protein n=1 Tax=Nephila pilipes TaxID=299642 RepID=A0A8X6QVX8_NEPPI|nr:uncharacterized protein NPIL_517731 [Nephila pilipes]